MCRVENSISLCMVSKVVFIILIPNEYHQFRVWYEFVGMNFNREEHIGSTDKDMEVQCFGFVSQENLLRCSSLETSNRCTIVYISCSYYCKLSPGIWQICFKSHWLYLSSKVQFNYSAQLFCWYIYRVLVSWITSCSLRKYYNSNVNCTCSLRLFVQKSNIAKREMAVKKCNYPLVL